MDFINTKTESTDPDWDWIDISSAAPSVEESLVYAGETNVFRRRFYDLELGFLRKPVAAALEKAGRVCLDQGFRLVVLDAYRPWSVTREMWDSVPESKKSFVANPSRGSRHNRGAAVDVTLKNLEGGSWVEMPSTFDDFSEKAHADFDGVTFEARKNREFLRRVMIEEGFTPLQIEWWHFDFPGWESLPVSDISLDELKCRTGLNSDQIRAGL